MSETCSYDIPRAGMLATVRNRSGVVTAVEPFDGDTGRLHLVHVEYKDSRSPTEERVLWELEPRVRLLEPTALPDTTSADAMPPEDGWRHLAIVLEPLNPDYEPIELIAEDESPVEVIAELIEVIGTEPSIDELGDPR